MHVNVSIGKQLAMPSTVPGFAVFGFAGACLALYSMILFKTGDCHQSIISTIKYCCQTEKDTYLAAIESLFMLGLFLIIISIGMVVINAVHQCFIRDDMTSVEYKNRIKELNKIVAWRIPSAMALACIGLLAILLSGVTYARSTECPITRNSSNPVWCCEIEKLVFSNLDKQLVIGGVAITSIGIVLHFIDDPSARNWLKKRHDEIVD